MSDQATAISLPVSSPSLAPAKSVAPATAARTRLLLEGAILPTLLRLAAPNVLTLLAFAGVITFDGFFLGCIGTNALAGASLDVDAVIARKPQGVLIVEEDLVRVSDLEPNSEVYRIPATRIAEELGKRMVLNSVMVGFFTSVTKLLTADAVRQAVADSVPASFRELNLQAFERGFEYGNAERAAAPPRAGLQELTYSSE